MAKTGTRCAAATLLGLTIFTLGSGCAGSLTVEEYVSRVFDIQCERIFACCTKTEQDALALGDGEAGCREALRSAEPEIDAKINDAIFFQDVGFDSSEAKSCTDTLSTSSCEWYFGSTAHECSVFTFPAPVTEHSFEGLDSVGLNHFIGECPLKDCLATKIVPACNGSQTGK